MLGSMPLDPALLLALTRGAIASAALCAALSPGGHALLARDAPRAAVVAPAAAARDGAATRPPVRRRVAGAGHAAAGIGHGAWRDGRARPRRAGRIGGHESAAPVGRRWMRSSERQWPDHEQE